MCFIETFDISCYLIVIAKISKNVVNYPNLTFFWTFQTLHLEKKLHLERCNKILF